MSNAFTYTPACSNAAAMRPRTAAVSTAAAGLADRLALAGRRTP
jgi:hypothetical protein